MHAPEVLERAGLSAFRRLPRRLRRFLIRWGAPRFTVGAAVVARNAAGDVLLVRQRHTGRWALPGGLLRRGEEPVDGVRREVQEEIGLALRDLDGPTVVVDARARRIDLVFTCAFRAEGDVDGNGPEVLDVGWFPPTQLPDVTGPTITALRAVA